MAMNWKFELDHFCCLRNPYPQLMWTEFQTQFEMPDGSVLLHVIRDCPRSYYMSFIVKKGWPLLPAFSNRVCNLFEGGESRAPISNRSTSTGTSFQINQFNFRTFARMVRSGWKCHYCSKTISQAEEIGKCKSIHVDWYANCFLYLGHQFDYVYSCIPGRIVYSPSKESKESRCD